MLLLAGFTGSIVVSTLVDSMLGYVPAEFGPVYRFAEQVNISRFRTLLVKWGVMVMLASADLGGLHGDSPRARHAHHARLAVVARMGCSRSVAVGITSSSLIAVLGSMGLLVSMLIFVILGLPSAGATVPLEAVPPFFRWLAEFEPMHQVFLGVRSLLYLNGQADAGLSQALMMTAIGLVDRAVARRHHHAHVRPQGLPPDPGSRRDGDRRGTPSAAPGTHKARESAQPNRLPKAARPRSMPKAQPDRPRGQHGN